VSEAALLTAHEVATGYGVVPVLNGVSLELHEGEVVALIGANGVGKTTLMNALVGQLPLWRGQVLLAGRRVSGLPPHRIVRQGMALVPEGRQLFAELSVEDNLRVGAHARGRDGIAQDVAHWLEFFPVLAERRRQSAGLLSGGEQQMLALARALMSRPKVLLLDEPSLGLAPKVIASVFDFIPRIRENRTAILLVEQNARLALQRSDRAAIMRRGQIVLEGPSAELASDDRVRELYLGRGSHGPEA